MNIKTVFVAVFLVVVASLALSSSMGGTPPKYTINGLTCQLTRSVFAGPQNISEEIPVIQQVAQTPQFLSATKGLPYVLGYAGIDTDRWETINNTTFHLPNVLELGFVTAGPATACVYPNHWINDIDVQIPILNGTYDMAAENVASLGGPK